MFILNLILYTGSKEHDILMLLDMLLDIPAVYAEKNPKMLKRTLLESFESE